MQSENSPRKSRAKHDFSSLIRRGYTFGKSLGKGSYASVIKAKHLDQETGTTQELACKYIDKKKAPADFLEKFFPRELNILTRVSHPNIIRVHSILQSGSTVYIFMRMAEFGDLLDYVKNFGRVDEQQSNMWFFQLTSAIKYLHSLNIAHRDLKCENVLISKHLNLKIADFGFARDTVDTYGEKIFSSTFCGSAAYAPPEIIDGIEYLPTKSDIWSLGIILTVMLYGSMPFDDSNMKRLRECQMLRKTNLDSAITSTLTLECREVIYECLTPDSKDRPTIDQLYSMKWLEKRVMKEFLAELNKTTIS